MYNDTNLHTSPTFGYNFNLANFANVGITRTWSVAKNDYDVKYALNNSEIDSEEKSKIRKDKLFLNIFVNLAQYLFINAVMLKFDKKVNKSTLIAVGIPFLINSCIDIFSRTKQGQKFLKKYSRKDEPVNNLKNVDIQDFINTDIQPLHTKFAPALQQFIDNQCNSRMSSRKFVDTSNSLSCYPGSIQPYPEAFNTCHSEGTSQIAVVQDGSVRISCYEAKKHSNVLAADPISFGNVSYTTVHILGKLANKLRASATQTYDVYSAGKELNLPPDYIKEATTLKFLREISSQLIENIVYFAVLLKLKKKLDKSLAMAVFIPAAMTIAIDLVNRSNLFNFLKNWSKKNL